MERQCEYSGRLKALPLCLSVVEVFIALSIWFMHYTTVSVMITDKFW